MGEDRHRYLEEGMLEAVLLAPSAAWGHEVVRPPAADREKVKPCSVAARSPTRSWGLQRAHTSWPDLADSAQSGAPSRRDQSPRQGFPWDGRQNAGAWDPLAEIS